MTSKIEQRGKANIMRIFGGMAVNSRKKCSLLLLITLFPLFTLAQDSKPHVVFIAGEEEYAAHWTLPKIAADLETRFNIKSTVIHSWRSGVNDYDMPGTIEIPEYDEIKNLEVIKDADLIVLHIRFRIPPPEQYDILQDYFDAGKPAIAFRTTSHGFWPADRKGWFVPFFGGHYKGHMPNTEGTTTIVPAEQLDHPILRGVPKRRSWNDVMGIYITAPLNDSATPLMLGKTGLMGPAQPVTWVNEYQKGQKIFYTSMGGLESFIDPGFINMVYNAVYWALDREVPENGVLNLKEISDFGESAPFERYSFGAVMENPFERPPEDLALENAMDLDAEFMPVEIPAPPSPSIPENAIVLFDGKDLSKWRHWDLSADPIAMLPDARAVSPSPEFNEARWPVLDGVLQARPGYGSILTKEAYGNYRLHLDFLIPEEPDYVPARFKGSGGIYLDGRYEVKILDSYGKEPSEMSNGSIFLQTAPSSNPSKPVNQWQSLDIEYRHYNGQRPRISVTLNGTKIHDDVTVISRSPFAIREGEVLFKSSEKDGSELYNLNRDNWAAEIEFRTYGGGYLISNAPENQPWNENSKGLVIYDEVLVYRNGHEYEMVTEEAEEGAISLVDGKWHKILLTSDAGKVSIYLDGTYLNQFENGGASELSGHVLRIGQGTKIFRLGASELPTPYPGESFDGEISKVRFFKKALSKSEIAKLNQGEDLSKESLLLDWKANTSQKLENVKKGPIRIQSDLSKIRYANIWLQPLGE